MEPSTNGEESQATSEPASADAAITEVNPSTFVSIKEQCSACGVAMASDQRYCVECGQRCGPARVPAMDELAQGARGEPAGRRAPRRGRRSVDTTLIAGVGALLLAMGIGVLIGRSGTDGSGKSPRVQVVTVAGGGGAASGGASTSAAATPAASGGSATSTKPGGAHTTASAKSRSNKAATAPPNTVTVGSPGHGPGYKSGHFTGNFFGE